MILNLITVYALDDDDDGCLAKAKCYRAHKKNDPPPPHDIEV